jgi:3-methyladenine DNA glycosylase AlkD
LTSWKNQAVNATKNAFRNQENSEKAEGAFAYMKGIAPFIGISAPDRRLLTKGAWKDLRPPSNDELGTTALALMQCREREYHYAAFDLVDTWIKCTDEYFLAEHVGKLLITKPWWDTVDGLVSAAVSPLCFRYDATSIIDEWSESNNRWLIRAAIGHQRSWRKNTDIERVFELCDRHWSNDEFFIAKAIGWALRDIAKLDRKSVQRFLKQHPQKNTVATREAKRGIEASHKRDS